MFLLLCSGYPQASLDEDCADDAGNGGDAPSNHQFDAEANHKTTVGGTIGRWSVIQRQESVRTSHSGACRIIRVSYHVMRCPKIRRLSDSRLIVYDPYAIHRLSEGRRIAGMVTWRFGASEMYQQYGRVGRTDSIICRV